MQTQEQAEMRYNEVDPTRGESAEGHKRVYNKKPNTGESTMRTTEPVVNELNEMQRGRKELEDAGLEIMDWINSDPHHDDDWRKARRNAPTNLTIEEIFEIEPRLKQLEADIRAVDGSTKIFCRNWSWFGVGNSGQGFKRRMVYLVGHLAENPVLGSSRTYDLVYRHLHDQLPDCNHPGPYCS